MEPFDTAGGVDDALLSGEEGVADRAYINGEVLAGCGQRFDHIAAGASDGHVLHDGMDIFLHKGSSKVAELLAQ